MEEKPLIIFFTISAILTLAFVLALILIIIQYRQRKLQHSKETMMINKLHKEELLKTQLSIQVQTLQDIGREIHDNVGQKLTLASIYAQRLSHQATSTINIEEIKTIGGIINDSLSALRTLSKSISNETVTFDELIENLETEFNKLRQLNVCHIHFKHESENYSLSTTQKTFLIRIVQEFTQNSLKHATCKNIEVQLSTKHDSLLLIMKDDGIGFNTNEKYEGIGLHNMRTRASLLNATFSIASNPNAGTNIRIELPLKETLHNEL